MDSNRERRLVIVSNRLPLVIKKTPAGWDITTGSGGLVTAIAPVLRNRGGLWIGWSGAQVEESLEEPLREASRNMGYELLPVILSADEISAYYSGFSNEIIWPLFHDLQSRCNFDPAYWECYREVNRKFAETIRATVRTDDYIWVHDYHLMNVAQELHHLGTDQKVGFFLHIPFPSPDIFEKLPWRNDLIHALLEFDLLGFQTLRDRRNFLQCVRTFVHNVKVQGKAKDQVVTLEVGSRTIKAGSFPISIDFAQFALQAEAKEVADSAWFIHETLGDNKIILGVDRLDYTKGILQRLKAFERALVKYPHLHHKISFIQVVVPSRVDIPEYRDLQIEIEQLIGNINGRFTKYGWVPIQYIFRNLDRYELLGYYRTAEIALITPLKDGMNLVAKEYCACSLEEKCVLILSEFAGASAQLHRWSLMVNPYDVDGIADAICAAFEMDAEQCVQRMHRLRQVIRKYDIFWWVDSFLEAAFTEKLYSFPILEEYDMREYPPER
jgi:trehalose 6-phosphate synthase/phosphatase